MSILEAQGDDWTIVLLPQRIQGLLLGALIDLPQKALNAMRQPKNSPVQSECLSLLESVSREAGQTDQQHSNGCRGRGQQDVPPESSEIRLRLHSHTVLQDPSAREYEAPTLSASALLMFSAIRFIASGENPPCSSICARNSSISS